MEVVLEGLGWLVAGGTLGMVLMSLMFLAKECDRHDDEDRHFADGSSNAAQ